MIHMDYFLVEFLKHNWITLSAGLLLLKTMAISFNWSKTNSILETLHGLFFSIKNGNFNGGFKKEE